MRAALPAARTRASSPGRPTSCTERRQAVLRRAARQRERRPAQRVERIREPDRALADRQLVDVGGRRDEADRRRQEQVEAVERLLAALAVPAPRALGRRHLGVGHEQAALELGADVVAVRVRVLGEEAAMDVGDLAHEERGLGLVAQGEVEPGGGAGRRPLRPRRGRGRAGRRARARRRRPRSSSSDSSSRRREPRHERAHQLDATLDRRRQRPDVVVARREWEAAVGRDEIEGRLEAGDPAPGSGDPDRASRVACRARARRRPRRSPPPSRRSSRRRGVPARAGSGRCRSAGSARRCRTRTRAGSSCPRPRSRPPRAGAPPRRCVPARARRRAPSRTS